MNLIELKLTEEEIKSVEDLSACNYAPEKIALYLEQDKKAFMLLWFDKKSEIRIAYERGKLLSDFVINQKQLDLAKSGNITAAQIFLNESEKNRVATIRNQILFGYDVD